MIYLDNSATTQVEPSVLQSYMHVATKLFANPSAIHTMGGEVEAMLSTAKTQMATLLHIHPEEIVMTSGGTEGNNIAIKGIAEARKRRGNHIITTVVEHPSVYETCAFLETKGFEITYLSVDRSGAINIEQLKEALTEETILVTMMHVNNEIGTMQPIEEVGKILSTYPNIAFHVDAVQSLGKIPMHIKEWNIDACTFSGHKIHGVKGTGMLYLRKGLHITPLFHGGNQEGGLRSGTEHVPGIVAFARALRLALEKERSEKEKIEGLFQKLHTEVRAIKGIHVNSSPDHSSPFIFHFSAPGLKPEVLIHMLGEERIFVSTKSACSSKGEDTSRVLQACGYDTDRSSTGIRVSMTYETTEEEIATFINVLQTVVQQLTKVME